MAETDKKVNWPGWETVRLIGQGNHGPVYEIRRDFFGNSDKAALKVISIPQSDSEISEMISSGCDDKSVADFFRTQAEGVLREYSLVRRLSGSANIVNVDDFKVAQQDNGLGWDIYVRMELLTPVTEAFPSELPEEMIVRLAKDLCRALTLYHQLGLIHRNIKPQNIFVSPNGDFKLGDPAVADLGEMAGSAGKSGSYRFMAPEICHGQPYGTCADIYSLGLVLYWLLNERRMPFQPLPPEALSAAQAEQALQRRFDGEPLTAPANGSGALKRIVLKACAYDQKDRYQSAEDMLRALEQLSLESLPECPAPAPLPYSHSFEDTGSFPCIGGEPHAKAESMPQSPLPQAQAPMPYAPPRGNVGASPYMREEPRPKAESRPRFPSQPAPARRRGIGGLVGAFGDLFTKKRPQEPIPTEQKASETSQEPETAQPVQTAEENESRSVEFSAVAPKGLTRGEYAIVNVIMYEKEFRFIVDRLKEDLGDNSQEKRSGIQKVRLGAAVKVLLTSPDIPIDDPLEEGIWQGEHLAFSFAVMLPEDYPRRQVLLQASVYIDGVISTRLKFVFDCTSGTEQKPEVSRKDILSAFVSYASQDRKRVATILQGMQKARPDLDVFFDIDSIRSGAAWEEILHREIDRRDVLFLFWSQNARESKWVDTEWRYALKCKGEEAIEPVPIELPDKCPPPKELENKFFGEKLLYIINSSV